MSLKYIQDARTGTHDQTTDDTDNAFKEVDSSSENQYKQEFYARKIPRTYTAITNDMELLNTKLNARPSRTIEKIKKRSHTNLDLTNSTRKTSGSSVKKQIQRRHMTLEEGSSTQDLAREQTTGDDKTFDFTLTPPRGALDSLTYTFTLPKAINSCMAKTKGISDRSDMTIYDKYRYLVESDSADRSISDIEAENQEIKMHIRKLREDIARIQRTGDANRKFSPTKVLNSRPNFLGEEVVNVSKTLQNTIKEYDEVSNRLRNLKNPLFIKELNDKKIKVLEEIAAVRRSMKNLVLKTEKDEKRLRAVQAGEKDPESTFDQNEKIGELAKMQRKLKILKEKNIAFWKEKEIKEEREKELKERYQSLVYLAEYYGVTWIPDVSETEKRSKTLEKEVNQQEGYAKQIDDMKAKYAKMQLKEDVEKLFFQNTQTKEHIEKFENIIREQRKMINEIVERENISFHEFERRFIEEHQEKNHKLLEKKAGSLERERAPSLEHSEIKGPKVHTIGDIIEIKGDEDSEEKVMNDLLSNSWEEQKPLTESRKAGVRIRKIDMRTNNKGKIEKKIKEQHQPVDDQYVLEEKRKEVQPKKEEPEIKRAEKRNSLQKTVEKVIETENVREKKLRMQEEDAREIQLDNSKSLDISKIIEIEEKQTPKIEEILIGEKKEKENKEEGLQDDGRQEQMEDELMINVRQQNTKKEWENNLKYSNDLEEKNIHSKLADEKPAHITYQKEENYGHNIDKENSYLGFDFRNQIKEKGEGREEKVEREEEIRKHKDTENEEDKTQELFAKPFVVKKSLKDKNKMIVDAEKKPEEIVPEAKVPEENNLHLDIENKQAVVLEKTKEDVNADNHKDLDLKESKSLIESERKEESAGQIKVEELSEAENKEPTLEQISKPKMEIKSAKEELVLPDFLLKPTKLNLFDHQEETEVEKESPQRQETILEQKDAEEENNTSIIKELQSKKEEKNTDDLFPNFGAVGRFNALRRTNNSKDEHTPTRQTPKNNKDSEMQSKENVGTKQYVLPSRRLSKNIITRTRDAGTHADDMVETPFGGENGISMISYSEESSRQYQTSDNSSGAFLDSMVLKPKKVSVAIGTDDHSKGGKLVENLNIGKNNIWDTEDLKILKRPRREREIREPIETKEPVKVVNQGTGTIPEIEC